MVCRCSDSDPSDRLELDLIQLRTGRAVTASKCTHRYDSAQLHGFFAGLALASERLQRAHVEVTLILGVAITGTALGIVKRSKGATRLELHKTEQSLSTRINWR